MASSPLLLTGCSQFQKLELYTRFLPNDEAQPKSPPPEETDLAEIQSLPDTSKMSQRELSDLLLKNEAVKSEHFSLDFPDDILLMPENAEMFRRLLGKFRAVQNHIGFGHFNLVGIDEFFSLADRIPSAGALTNAEKKYLEELFYFDAGKYGFKGAKVQVQYTDAIKKSDVLKIPHTGHFLKKGEAIEIYEKVRKDIGPSLFLTSGVRGLAKQFHLFMEKTIESKGNLSKASRSLAPPGYSFHGRGDFDVGKKGYGIRNFTRDFAITDEYKRLLDLGYINIRYTQSNLLGVRFEPWHIKIEG